jgi:hypothetical protein
MEAVIVVSCPGVTVNPGLDRVTAPVPAVTVPVNVVKPTTSILYITADAVPVFLI